jgi:hypothetical protein
MQVLRTRSIFILLFQWGWVLAACQSSPETIPTAPLVTPLAGPLNNPLGPESGRERVVRGAPGSSAISPCVQAGVTGSTRPMRWKTSAFAARVEQENKIGPNALASQLLLCSL